MVEVMKMEAFELGCYTNVDSIYSELEQDLIYMIKLTSWDSSSLDQAPNISPVKKIEDSKSIM